MTSDKFLQGFIKQAEEKGFSNSEAQRLLKEAGILGSVGNFLYDGIVQPAKGIFTEGKAAFSDVLGGNWRSAGRHMLNTAGNVAMTGLNFIPGAGLGSLAVRGGLRAAGGLAARTGMNRVAGMAGNALGKFTGMQNMARSAVGNVTAPMFRGAGNLMQRAGQGINNVAGRNFIPGAPASNVTNWAGNQMTRMGSGLRTLGNNANRGTGAFSPLSPNTVTGGMPRAGGLLPKPVTPNPGMMHRARTFVNGIPGNAARGAVASAPILAADQYVDNYRQDLEDNPYGDMRDYFNDKSIYL